MLLEGAETTVDLHDLRQLNASWKGILSPLYDDGLVQKYIHEQFLENASHYVDVYQNVPHWKDLLGTANRHLALDPAGSLRILDLGSGGGNTVFALHELYPKARADRERPVHPPAPDPEGEPGTAPRGDVLRDRPDER